MKLISCYVEGFGNLAKKDYNFEDLTVIMRGNGAGKTTLASFIKAMFYGLPSVRAGGSFNERQRFCPFDGSRFGGNLTFEKGGKVYRVERFFDRKSETRDELNVSCGGRRIAVSDLGRETFGLDMQSFTRTAFITSEITESGAGGDINRLLNRDAGAVDGADFEAAVAALDLKRKELKADRGKKGYLFDKKDERQSLVSEIEQLRERERELGARYSERARLTEEIAALEGAKELANENRVLSAKRAVLDGLRVDISEKRAELVDLEREYPRGIPRVEELDLIAERQTEIIRLGALSEGAGKKQGSGKARYALLSLAVLLIAAGAWLCTVTLAGIAVLALGIAAVAGFSYLSVKSRKNGGAANGYAEQISRLQARTDEVFALYNLPKTQDISGAIKFLRQKRLQYDGLCDDICDLERRARKYREEHGLDRSETLAGGTEGVEDELRDKRRRLGILDSAIAAEEAELELLPDKLSRLESVDEELAELTKKHETLVMAAEFLKQADRAVKDRYVAPVRGRFEFYADGIKAVLGQKMSMDADFSVSFEKNGSIMCEKHLSAGQRSIISLCLRLALIDNMYKDEKPFIVMDDPFINLDGANFEGCKRVIRALSKQIQIIYFTCHNSRVV